MCLVCNTAFASRQAWGSHASRCHGYRARHNKAACGRSCVGCGRIYANPGRLRRHLSNSRSCLMATERSDRPEGADDVGHAQAPPVFQCSVGVWRAAQHDACEFPEFPEIAAALSAAVPTTASEIVAIVQRFVGPLPDIRAVLRQWGDMQEDSGYAASSGAWGAVTQLPCCQRP